MTRAYKYLTGWMAISTLFFSGLSAEEKDTVRHGEIIVIGTPLAIKGLIAGNGLLLRNNALFPEISDVLSLLPGSYLKDLGGLGSIKTLSYRGSNPSQTLTLFNGIRMNSAQNAVADMAVIPSSFISGIRISGGGTNGSNAMAGTLALGSSRTPGHTGDGSAGEPAINYGASYGSFGDAGLFANGTFAPGPENVTTTLMLDHRRSKGNFPFTVSYGGQESGYKRNNADFSSTSAGLQASWNAIRDSASFFLMIQKNYRGVPGPVLSGSMENSGSRFDETNILTSASYGHRYEGGSVSGISVAYKYGGLHYADTSAKEYSPEGLLNDYYVAELNPALKYTFGLSENISAASSVEYLYAHLESDNLNDDLTDVQRKVLSISEKMSGVFDFERFVLFTEISARLDWVEEKNHTLASAVIGALIKPLNLKASAGYTKGYRLPSFNELYYFNFGNRHLRPEFSDGIEAELNYAGEPVLFLGTTHSFALRASAYHRSVEDQIVSFPKSLLVWTAMNLQRVNASGFALTYEGVHFDEILSLMLNYSYNETRDMTEGSFTYGKLVPYMPQEIFSALAILDFQPLSVQSSATRYSFVYTTSENNRSLMIPGRTVVNAGLSYKFETGERKYISLNAGVKNIFDLSYQTILNYPMPGRQFSAGIEGNL